MVSRYHITVGAPTTAGGKVLPANSNRTIDGVAVAYVGDPVSCPKCKSTGVIAPDGPRLDDVFDGRQAALSDDLCMCQCKPPPRLMTAQTHSFQAIEP